MTLAQANANPKPKRDAPVRAKSGAPEPASVLARPKEGPPARGLYYLRDLGRLLDDLESTRIRNSNRIGAYEREFGVAPPHYIDIQERLRATEHESVLALQREWRKHPLAPWAKTIPGAGEKLMARLIAVIGDPYIATPHKWVDGVLHEGEPYPRTVSQLWQFCGHGNPHLKRQKGMTQDEAFRLGNPEAKKRAYLLGAQFVKTMNSPYREVYEERRAVTGDRDWTLGHQHADAIRVTTKEFLKDLWLAARASRETGPMTSSPESQESF